ncbi:MAG: FtsW/RodA/SpoVE family cell cycle protein [Candidatus Nanopelagicaceae bacterium]
MLKNPVSTFKTFLWLSFAILIFGDIMVISAAQVLGLNSGGNSFSISWKQILVSIISLPFAWLISKFPLKTIKWFAHRSLGFAILFMLLLIPFGRNVNGNTNWISIGPIDFQPSEVAKVFLILWSAYIIENNFGEPRKITIRLTIGFTMVLAVVLKGGDLGSAVVIGLVLATLIYLAGAESKYIAGLAVAGILGVAGLVAMQPYRIARFTAFVHPFAEDVYKNAGWQPAHSLMALGSGGLFGSGIGASKQKWGNLAEAHTDFIFGVIGEEFGLLGTLATITAISLLVICITKIALTAEDTFSRYLGLGIAFWIGFQSLINLASATSLIPVVGVTLPFLSYGGSSLLALVGALGFVAGIALRNPQVANEFRIRKRKGVPR